MLYFKKHWSTELQDDVVKCVEKVVSEISCHSLVHAIYIVSSRSVIYF